MRAMLATEITALQVFNLNEAFNVNVRFHRRKRMVEALPRYSG